MIHSKIQHYGPLVGRVLLALLFLVSAFGMLTNFGATASYFGSIGIPMATIAVLVALTVKIGGGLMVALGVHARVGAMALIGFTLATIFFAHLGAGQMIPALKNLAIVGGLLLIVVNGAGSMSLRDKCPCPRCKGSKMSAAGGVCNCGYCEACLAAKKDGGTCEVEA
ncbi:LysR family transcriptional regulator [Candidatus Kaiserbacteria bacterium]|nr:MAG: LysR family transcriptional regulator [Candidatus Kaiserbacteria bacterium]